MELKEIQEKKSISTLKNYFPVPIIPANESGRLKSLHKYEILDTQPEIAFDHIVKTCCLIFDVPIALISFVDHDRVFFKANEGLPGINNVERGKSLCSLAILKDEVTVFENALTDACLFNNPLVMGDFGLRFYAGAPLKTKEGYNIGALCIVSKETRSFSEKEKQILENLAAVIMDEIELRISTIKALRTQNRLIETSEEKNRELLRINKELDTFVYLASHDLKAPIVSIEGLLRLLSATLKKEVNLNEDVDIIIPMIYKSIDKFKLTVKELSEISKLQNQVAEEVKEINLNELLTDIISSNHDLIELSGAKIYLDTSKANTISFSKINLHSIFFNLISNSIKHKSKDNNPVIFIETNIVKKNLVIKIKDNGAGISKENQERIFDMFKRFNDEVEGSGVGLYLVKKIVENANGRIELESEVGKGSTFTIYLKNNG